MTNKLTEVSLETLLYAKKCYKCKALVPKTQCVGYVTFDSVAKEWKPVCIECINECSKNAK